MDRRPDLYSFCPVSTLPRPLKTGACIAVIAPSGSPENENHVEPAIQALRDYGFRVQVGKSVHAERVGYLAATDEVRAADVNAAFADPDVDAILCLKGGYGTPRILDMLDYARIRDNPKLFIGYSDITALHLAIARHAGFPTMHGFMALNLVGDRDERSLQRWFETITAEGALGVLPIDEPHALTTLSPGATEGRLTGGNLSLVSALVGTSYALDPRGAILFLEDVGEEPYRVDRMLNQLRLADYFEQCAGVVLGTWKGCTPEEPERSMSLYQVFSDYFARIGKPVLAGVPAGHGYPALTIPLGVAARLDANQGMLEILESAVGT
ncbi:MAG: LD-carboxypeptidase [Spirochaetaceae bacterium]|nr:MAG: LD-carboxypeptidase [Spirochaetaceae bacterium]